MKRKILLFPSAWSNEAVFKSQLAVLQNQYELIFPNIHPFDDIGDMAQFVIGNYHDVYALIGLSMGGFVVQDILCRVPNFAKKAILMGTYCHTHDEGTKTFYRGLLEQVQSGHFEKVISLFTNVVISPARITDQQLRDEVGKLPRALGESYCINHHNACISWRDHTEAVKGIKADTLILAGAVDAAVPLAHLQKLYELIPGSTLKVIQNAGHLMGVEEPEQVNSAIVEFLK